jgi:sulfite exporter TauE/SafE
MLTSITPLGERSRGFSWRLTASAFALGAIGGGVATGAACGLLGSLLGLGDSARAGAAAAVLALALVLDGPRSPLRLPTSRRQVNEDWLGRYRGWVYGVAFGAQLGAGVATIVTTAAVYATWLIAVISGAPLIGAAVGGTFGLVRAVSLLPAGTVTDPLRLLAAGRALDRWEARTRGLAPLVEVILLAIVIGVLA